MKQKNIYFTILFITLICGLLINSCNSEKFTRKKIVYINSYHRGHPSSDEIMDAVLHLFPADSFDLRSYFMNTKRNPSEDFIKHISTQLYDSIVSVNPDILIVSDDNAVKYIVQPNINQLPMPVVFCGVNGSDLEYNLPPDKVTGMLEILPIYETIAILRQYYPDIKKLCVLTENTTTSRKEKILLDTMFNRIGLEPSYKLVNDYNSWMFSFLEANRNFDIIYLVTYGAIQGWDNGQATEFVQEHLQVPVVTCEDFMMPFAVFGLAKVAVEQGQWAAETAKKILKGKSPADFPVTRNQLHTTWLNVDLAEKIGFQPDTSKFVNFHLVE